MKLSQTLALALLVAAGPPAAAQSDSPNGSGGGGKPAAEGVGVVEAALTIPRGSDLLPLLIPRDEELVYRARIDLGLIDTPVGTVTMSGGVEPYKRSVLLRQEGDEAPGGDETGWMKIHAAGDYTLYSMDATIETRILPQDWPHLSYRYVHKGTENRRREILVGERDGKPMASYRKDTRHNAPRGTRIWREPEFREVPEGTLDMLGAVYLVRSMIREGQDVVRFPLIDKLRLWEMTVRRGAEQRVTTRAGTFDAVLMLLDPRPYPGEDISEEKQEDFEGLFGMHGSIQLWVERNTGIPLLIKGDLPVGPLTLGVEIELKGYRGTPPRFDPVAK